MCADYQLKWEPRNSERYPRETNWGWSYFVASGSVSERMRRRMLRYTLFEARESWNHITLPAPLRYNVLHKLYSIFLLRIQLPAFAFEHGPSESKFHRRTDWGGGYLVLWHFWPRYWTQVTSKIEELNNNKCWLSFPWVKQPGRGNNHSPHLAPCLKKE